MNEQRELPFEGYEVLFDSNPVLVKRNGSEDEYYEVEVYDTNDEGKAWFEENIGRLISCEHPSIAPITEYHVHRNAIYIVYPISPGRNLEEVYHRAKNLPLYKIVQWGIEICEAAEVFHQLEPQYIVETVRPMDIFINKNGNALLRGHGLDLKVTTNGQPNAMLVDLAIGNYFAPEHRARNDEGRQLTPQLDIFCIGITLHQLVTHQHPWTDYSDAEKLYKLAPMLKAVNAPQDVSDIILKATADKAQERFATISEMKDALKTLPQYSTDIASAKNQ